MTKPLPTGCIKRCKNILSQREFDLIVQSIPDEDKIGHLLIVDIEFDHENARKNIFCLTRSTLLF